MRRVPDRELERAKMDAEMIGRAVDVPVPGTGKTLLITPEYSDRREDWSACRSPGRARRRLKAGKPQRVRKWREPRPGHFDMEDGTVVCHPRFVYETRDELLAEVAFEDRCILARVPLVRGLQLRATWRRERERGALPSLVRTGWWRAPIWEEMESRAVWDDVVSPTSTIEVVDFALRIRDGRQVVVCGNLEVGEI